MKTQKAQILDILRDEVFVPVHMQDAARISKLEEIVIKLAEQIDLLKFELKSRDSHE
jgi:hypothetical protein